MTNEQDGNSTATAASLGSTKEATQNNASQISTAPDKDALGDGSLDAVSGGSWPYATMSSAHVGPTI